MNFEIVFSELKNSTEVIRALLAGITEEEARLKPNAASWSILEVVCHLCDEEREDFREHLDFILHRQREEWHLIDPEAWVTERKYNDQDFQVMCETFFAERNISLNWLGGLKDPNWEIAYTSVFGSMRAGDMLVSWVAHDNLHVRQLVELRRWKIEDITRPYTIEYAGDW